MPLYKTINPKKNTKIYVWDITESLDDLNNLNLSQKSDLRLRNMKSELHQKGFLSIRHLLKIAGYADKDLYYNSHGKQCFLPIVKKKLMPKDYWGQTKIPHLLYCI